MSMETTLIIIKPDGVQRGLVGAITERIERSGLQFTGIKLMAVTEELAREHYQEHVGKPFFDGLVAYITSSPVVVLAVTGLNAITKMRNLIGATDPLSADTGTIRGDYGQAIGRNLIHGSANAADAARELAIFFTKNELLEYPRSNDRWIYE